MNCFQTVRLLDGLDVRPVINRACAKLTFQLLLKQPLRGKDDLQDQRYKFASIINKSDYNAFQYLTLLLDRNEQEVLKILAVL